MFNEFIENLLLTGAYYLVCIIYIVLTGFLTIKGTAFDDIKEILAGNVAIAIHFGCKIIAIAVILQQAIWITHTIEGALVWGLVGTAFQLISFYALIYNKKIIEGLKNNVVAVGILSGSISFVISILVTSCIS